MVVCRYCLEAILSHGEEVIIEEELFEPGTCEWCEEEEEEELFRIRFK